MGLLKKRPSKTINKQLFFEYRLHMVLVLEDFNQMQQRYFIAADIQKQCFYHICEIIGNYGESRYILKKIAAEKARQFLQTGLKNNLLLDDWSSLANILQNTEIIEITKEQIITPRK